MKATNQKKMWQNNNSRGLGLLACMVLVCMGMGSSTVYGYGWGNTCEEAFGAGPISGDGAWAVDTDGATWSLPQTGLCATVTNIDIWLHWLATTHGTVTANTCDFDNDTWLAVYGDGGQCDEATPIVCNDDSNLCTNGLMSSVTWEVRVGERYSIRLGAWGESTHTAGTLVISTVPSSNGACCMPDGTCDDGVWEFNCSGSFQGDGSTCAGSICTPVSDAFTYQGKLMDNGVPVNGTADLRFILRDAATDGNMIGTQSWVFNVTVVDGLFTVTVNEANEFTGNAFIGAARWLAIGVRVPAATGSWTTLTPRQPITAAPFSKL